MITSKRVAFPLAVAAHIVLLYVLSTFGGHLMRWKEINKPVSVTLILERPIAPIALRPQKQEVASASTPKNKFLAKSAEASTTPAPNSAPVSAPIVVETAAVAALPPVNSPGVSLAQSALNAIGKMDQDDRRSTRRGANVMSNSLEARLSSSIDKYAAVKAGTIDEHVYSDGRREERVHTLFGGVYCITFESPSNPTDGFDTMQRGLKPSVPHSCGHRFD